MFGKRDRPKIVPVKDIPDCDIGAPMPTVLANSSGLHLLYYPQQNHPGSDRTRVHVRNNADTGIALVSFRHYIYFSLGHPNDEALAGHPLASYGLSSYTPQIVAPSFLLKELEKRNQIHPYHSAELFDGFHHYVYPFHDETLEVIAKGHEVQIFPDATMQELLLTVMKTEE